MAPLNFDAYQTKAINHVVNSNESMTLIARAGSGKSTLIAEVCRQISETLHPHVLVTAFNTHSVDDLARKVPATIRKKAELRTTYSAGFDLCREWYRPFGDRWVNEHKYTGLLDTLLLLRNLKPREKIVWADALMSLFDMARQTLTEMNDGEALQALSIRYQIDLPCPLSTAQEILCQLCLLGRGTARQSIDYKDMIWLPSQEDMQAKKKKAWVITDETQDMNEAQHDTLARHSDTKTRWCVVGDPAQAVYGWAGALPDGMGILHKRVKATPFKLPISYRCPVSHIELAQKWVKDIQAAPNARQGRIETMKIGKIAAFVKDSPTLPLICCRTTAPLIALCFELVANDIPAYVKGKQLGKRIHAIINACMSETENFDAFPERLHAYRLRMQAALHRLENHETEIMALHDRCDSALVLYMRCRQLDINTTDGMKRKCDEVFRQDDASVRLSTWHSAKGLEADCVISLQPELMPHSKAATKEQKAEEIRLMYIAATRSKDTLLLAAG